MSKQIMLLKKDIQDQMSKNVRSFASIFSGPGDLLGKTLSQGESFILCKNFKILASFDSDRGVVRTKVTTKNWLIGR